MSGTTSERFPCCRCCVDDPVWHEDNPRDTHETDCPTCSRAPFTTEVDHLTADNARLREGVAQIEALFDPIDYDGGLPGDAVHARNVARSLLNPPTEGETDDRR